MRSPIADSRGCDQFPNVHLDLGYDSAKTRDLLEILGFEPQIAAKVLALPRAAFTVIRGLINQARSRYRWPTRLTTRRLR